MNEGKGEIREMGIKKMKIQKVEIQRRIREKIYKKLTLAACCFVLLFCMGGCGRMKNGEETENTAPEPNSTVEEIIFTAPPDIKLSALGDDGNAITIASGGYNWTYLESEETAASAIADSADILAENSPWETFILPEDAADMQDYNYTISVAKLPDELGITAWDIADVGRTREECSAIESSRYSMEEIGAPDFTVSLQPGRIYEIYMEWDNEKLRENGFCGIAYYALKTGAESSTLTEKDNDILISLDDSYCMSVRREETREEIQSDSGSFASGFSDILIKYCNLNIVKDENQYTDDSVIYCMQIFDSDGQVVQTIEYTRDYLCIDKIRYRDGGVGTTRELFLAIDSLFQENFPIASFGEEDTGAVDVIEGVAMEAAYVTPKGIHLVFTNRTDEDYIFGDNYELQVWQDGKWRSVDYIVDNAAFNSIGYSLAGGAAADWDVKWTYFHGVLPDGQYRITKTISKENTGNGRGDYRLSAEFYIVNAGENKELDEANEKTFYEEAEAFGLEMAEVEGYFQMLCRDAVIQNGVMELRGLVIDDFDQNGQNDIAIMMQQSDMKFLYGTGCIYFYMNGEKTYCFYEKYFPFFNDFYVSSADLDNDGNTEIVFGARGTGNGGSGDWYNEILKYKNRTMERMGIPAETHDNGYVDGCLDVNITKDEKEGTYRACCEYLNDEIVVEAPNQERDYSGFGSNHRGFYDVHCVAYKEGYALQASVYLYGRGVADFVGEAKFLIVWDEDGSSHFEKWWVEPYYHG